MRVRFEGSYGTVWKIGPVTWGRSSFDAREKWLQVGRARFSFMRFPKGAVSQKERRAT